MSKKNFSTPKQVNTRKGVDLLINSDEPQKVEITSKDNTNSGIYTNYNVRVKQEYKEKIYSIKGKTGKSFTEIFDIIFESYFSEHSINK